MELKKGNKIKILESELFWRATRESETVNNFMCEYCGKIATITRVSSDGYECNLDIDNGKYWWNQNLFENK